MKCKCGEPLLKARQKHCIDCADKARRDAENAYRKRRTLAKKADGQDIWMTTMQRKGVRHV